MVHASIPFDVKSTARSVLLREQILRERMMCPRRLAVLLVGVDQPLSMTRRGSPCGLASGRSRSHSAQPRGALVRDSLATTGDSPATGEATGQDAILDLIPVIRRVVGARVRDF